MPSDTALSASGSRNPDFGPFHCSMLISDRKSCYETSEHLSSRGCDTEFPSQILKPANLTCRQHGLEVKSQVPNTERLSMTSALSCTHIVEEHLMTWRRGDDVPREKECGTIRSPSDLKHFPTVTRNLGSCMSNNAHVSRAFRVPCNGMFIHLLIHQVFIECLRCAATTLDVGHAWRWGRGNNQMQTMPSWKRDLYLQRIMIIDAQGEISYLFDDKISQISVNKWERLCVQ